jgi:hypothetical protein
MEIKQKNKHVIANCEAVKQSRKEHKAQVWIASG